MGPGRSSACAGATAGFPTGCVRDVLAVENDAAGGRFLQPHHRRARASICRIRIRRPGRPFRPGTHRDRPRPRARSMRRGSRKLSRGSTKCLTRSRTSSSGAAPWRRVQFRVATPACVGGCKRRAALRNPASRGSILADRQQRRMLDALRRPRTGSARENGSRRASRVDPVADLRSSSAVGRHRWLHPAVARHAAAPKCKGDADRSADPPVRLLPPPRPRTSPARASRRWRSRPGRG